MHANYQEKIDLTPEELKIILSQTRELSLIDHEFRHRDWLKAGYNHYSQVKLKALLSMSNFTHFLPVDPIKI